MKADIHPEYVEAKVTCGCGNSFSTRSTVAEIHVEICSACHPFYTGTQKFVDTAGRVERFQTKYGGEYFSKPKPKSGKSSARK
jgi:large subunit ribosomal protein L31